MTSTAIVTRATVRELIQCFNEAKANVRTGFSMIASAQKSLNDRFKLGGHTGVSIVLDRYSHRDADHLAVEETIAIMERQAWRSIVDRLDIWRVMSEARASELRKLIDEGKLPELTEDTAMQLAQAYVGNVDKLIDELTKEVFDWLRPRVDSEGRTYNGGKYKTNQRDVIGKRVVREFMVELSYMGGFHVRYRGEAAQRLRTLENLFRALDGKGSTGTGYQSDLQTAIEREKSGMGQTEYFKFRACKKGTLHIEFLREDLLAELNRRAGGMNLRSGKR
jgi:hypothetical protein